MTEYNSNTPQPTPPPNTAPQTEPKKKRGCFGFFVFFTIVFFLIAALGVCVFVATFMMNFSMPSLPTFTPQPSPIKFSEEYVMGNQYASDKIAVIDIKGVIIQENGGGWYQYADATMITEQLRYIQNDNSIHAVILRLDTPGGEVVASDIIHHEVEKLRETRGIPVIASMGSLAASGGYYVAVACDHIVANRMTTTGSIGVIIQTYEYVELFKKIGLQAEVFKSGPMKDILNGARLTTPAEKSIVQNLVNQTYNEFVSLVAKGRPGLTVEKIKGSEIGDGRIFTGKQALQLGLVDQLGFFEDAVSYAADVAGLGENYKVVRLSKPFSFTDIFKEVQSDTDTQVRLGLPGANSWLNAIEPGKIYMLPQFK